MHGPTALALLRGLFVNFALACRTAILASLDKPIKSNAIWDALPDATLKEQVAKVRLMPDFDGRREQAGKQLWQSLVGPAQDPQVMQYLHLANIGWS